MAETDDNTKRRMVFEGIKPKYQIKKLSLGHQRTIKMLDKLTIWDMDDHNIQSEIYKRIKQLRRSCCLSQQEFADKAGVSRETIKRIEGTKDYDITLSSLLKILRAGGMLQNITNLIEETPESLFINKQKRINSKLRHVNSKQPTTQSSTME